MRAAYIIESHNFYLNMPVALLRRLFDVALLGHVHTIEELTDILVADKGCLVDEGACGERKTKKVRTGQ